MDEVTEVKRKHGRPRKHPESMTRNEQAIQRRDSLIAKGYRLLGRVELSPEANAALEVLIAAGDRYANRAIENALLLAVKSRLA